MARTTPASRAGRTLVIFFMTIGVIYGLVAIAGSWKPELGLDLQGGTRITLIAKDQNNSSANLEEARKIIDRRVNGSGVTEAEVTTQGNRFIVVEIPGESRADLVDTVKRQAQLRFRVVAQTADGTARRVDRLRRAERPPVAAVGHRAGEPHQEAQALVDGVGHPEEPRAVRRRPVLAVAVPRAHVAAGGVRERRPQRRRHDVADGHPERRRSGRLGHRRPADLDGQPRPEVPGRVRGLPVPRARRGHRRRRRPDQAADHV